MEIENIREPLTQDPMAGRKIAFSHMGISCWNLAKMEDFYARVLGLHVSDRGTVGGGRYAAVFMTSDAFDHHQFVLVSGRNEGTIHETPVVGGSVGTAIFQISFRLDSLTTLRAFKRRLEGEGFNNITPRNHGNAWSLYLRDPEGNGVELFVDTPWFVHQPFGEWLDLSLSDEDIHRQTLALCQTRKDFEPHADWRARLRVVLLNEQSRFLTRS